MARSNPVVRMNSRGSVTIPKEVRQGLGEEALFETVRRSDGVIELRPQTTIAASQAWFWTERWQQMEREADADIRAERVKVLENVEDFLADLRDEGDGRQ